MIAPPRYPRLAIAVLAFAAGVFATSLFVWQQGPFSSAGPARAVGVNRVVAPADPDPGAGAAATTGTSGTAEPVDIGRELSARALAVPVEGIRREALVNSFHDARGQGRRHEAIDILAPRGTPVLAVEDGVVARLFTSAQGGLTIYQFDPSEQYVYYYAHLDRYADKLEQGDRIKRGQVIGYVGTTGNAPRNTPHLHFAIFKMTDEKKWWQGTPIDPFELLRKDK